LKIIVFDSNKETADVLEEVAKLSESEILFFDSFENLKNVLQEDADIDAIISEKNVNGASVSQIIAFLKSKNLDIPVILLTDQIDDEEKEYYTSVGVSQILTKPFNPLEVLTVVAEVLKEKKGEEYVKERLHSKDVDRSTLKAIIENILALFKKIFFRKKWNLIL